MKKLHLFIALIASSCSFVSCNNGGDRDGTLYLQSYYINGIGPSLNWIWLGDDGNIVYNPEHGVDPVNLEREKETNEESVGQYKIDGDEIAVDWENGKKSTLSIGKDGGKITTIDGGIVTIQRPLPDGFMLSGKYEGSAVFGNIASISTYSFKKSGLFSLTSFGSVSTKDVGSYSEDDLNGKYSITGNTIRLKFNNKEEKVATIGIMDDGEGETFLIMDQMSYPQREK